VASRACAAVPVAGRGEEPHACREDAPLETCVQSIRACRICRDTPRYGKPLDHEPRPVLQVSPTARICIAGQAPGTRVHASGRPFTDPSGVRLRQWLAIAEGDFYDPGRTAIVPMGFCFPGLSASGSDLPPRRECAEIWREELLARLPRVRLVLAVGGYAQKWHLGAEAAALGVDETVRQWRRFYDAGPVPRVIPLPHPSWRNNRWLKQNPWFATELLPVLQNEVRSLLARETQAA